ncbi:MAG TPA: aldo/keto reductase [Fibrobacteria bacterium]|nr:aldo/keto reductase [Fibrobacteria bacterium]
MKYREMGSTGRRVSVIGLGTWQFGGEWGKDYTLPEVEAVLDRAAGLGIDLLDTAECYGPDHLSESLIGRALQGKRDRWFIATKFGHEFTGHVQRKQAWSLADVAGQLEASLRALRTDRVDLYQFHSGSDADFHRDELWTWLSAQVKAGKIRHLGVSISSQGENLGQVEAAARYGFQAVQLVYNRLDRGPEEKVLPACKRLDLGVLARVPLASGYLSGKYRPGDAFPAGDVRASHEERKSRARLEQVMEIRRTEVPPEMDMAQWALAWCLRDPQVTAVIPGCKDPSQVERNAAAADLSWPV